MKSCKQFRSKKVQTRVLMVMSMAFVLSIQAAPYLKQASAFNTQIGKVAIPNEQPLAAWQVYSPRLVFKADGKESSYNTHNLPEMVALSFYQNLWLKKDIQHFLIEKPKAAFTQAVFKYANDLEYQKKFQYSEIRILAKVSKQSLKRLAANSRSIIHSGNIDAIEEKVGHFDLLIFIETPPLPHDTFIFLRQTSNGWKVVSSVGWLYSAKK